MQTFTWMLAAGALLAMSACQPTSNPSQTASPEAEAAPALTKKMPYPLTKKTDHVDHYHGTAVADPYRWLENDTTRQVAAWVTAQNKLTFGYLDQIPFRSQIRERLTKIWNYPKYGTPFKRGEHYYFYKNDGLQNQSVLYVQQGLKGSPQVFLDPNQFSADGTTSMTTVSFSKDNRYVAYGTSGGGSDWNTFQVMDTRSREKLSDKLEWIKFSGAAWFKNGFFYSRYDAPTNGSKLAAKNEYHKVYYHQLGTPQSSDKLIYQDATKPLRYFYAQTTDDEKFLIISVSEGATSTNALYVKDLSRESNPFLPVVSDFEAEYSVIDNIGDKLLVQTTHQAPRNKVVLIDPKKPQPANWKTLVPESEHVITGASLIDNRLIVNYMKNAASQALVFDLQGKRLHEIPLPTLGTVTGFEGKKEDKEVFYAFNSFTYPSTIYHYRVAGNTSTLFRKSELDLEMDGYETKQVFYPSKDGTKVPMFIVHKKGLVLDGNNPTFLYAYGGFNISLTPSFSVSRMLWLENGGIYVLANLRGGGEFGEEWHQAGMTPNKQNVFDDFIGAAEYLIQHKYTSPSKLAISGGSNGGLLVGAVANQRPDLFQVALPAVGVMDMLRFHKFTIGWGWVPEYGSSDKADQFKNLLAFSPLHNIRQGVSYPATLVTTADHDDRVVPAHSFKYIATLQEKGAGPNPYLIRIAVKAGHGAGKSTAQQIEEATDVWSFVYHNMGLNSFGSKE
ncbi:MAG: prolyl oligopeptidase family serine peptidase [Adhaeribacter sp.]